MAKSPPAEAARNLPSTEPALPCFSERDELLRGLLKNSETMPKIFDFKGDSVSIIPFLEHVNQSTSQKDFKIAGEKTQSTITRASLSLVNAISNKFCRPAEERAGALADGEVGSIRDSESKKSRSFLIKEYMKNVGKKTSRKTPLIEFKYVEGQPVDWQDSQSRSKVSFSCKNSNFMNKRDLKGKIKEKMTKHEM